MKTTHKEELSNDYYLKFCYQIDEELPEKYQSKFLPLERPDDSTLEWLERAKKLSSNICLQIWHTIARTFLQLFMTRTNINGLLKRGSMFILSKNQFALLLQTGGFDVSKFIKDDSPCITILDVGAGDGEISNCLLESIVSLKNNVNVRICVTEISWIMRARLKRRKFLVLDGIKNIQNMPLISCLNVLDRCYDPFELLEDMRNSLAPDGRLVIALVLPYVHYVEFNKSHMPNRPLMEHWPKKLKQLSFEKEATVLFKLMEDYGFKIESWTKAPYLCEGDLRQSFYWLTDIIVVLSKK